MNYRKILEDFVNNENTEYCYDWQGFNYEIILPCIEQLLKNENNLQSKIDKAIEFIKESNTYYEITHYIPEDEKQFKINMETLTNHLLDILKEDK